ncbi:nucleotidyl transferase AbiEii/AbiGii toxin family protein [uncultured Senegalimassilia sp.]|uniref:nucleotidyl transferase AbiEii/AbiGii toxin family protein n=1 Tax=uncultured Senegalimassilia sp. TaxID=1714350 RepID=UPI0026755198|nr:nucleotidyl transferase AbiEii/AbiGii toxin family protein [uncultured Senegalimassilia sp.]
MRYKTPAALEMAVKEAAKKSPLDTNRAIAGFYFHRLLCRVFSDPDSPFVLKGGQSVLARTVDARATRDIDLLAREASVEAAVADLRRLAGIGLDDFISFSFDKAEPIKADDECRSGMKVWFTPPRRQVPASRVRRPRGRRGRRAGAGNHHARRQAADRRHPRVRLSNLPR